MSDVFCGRISDTLAARIDDLIEQEQAGLKNRSQVIATALDAWATTQEGGQSLEDRIAARLEQVIKQELARVQIAGTGTQEPPDQHADKRRAFLKAGRR